MADCTFCAVLATSPEELVLAEDDVAAFLDHRPVFPGHALVVPRSHIQTLAEPTRYRLRLLERRCLPN